ncbi:hypothetical protein [Fictibacillus gelatini]|uniref:hypothetical protein n=1 Tax=Fictibacillus gelatini TaxID=225985 RepID=UPI0012B521AD|nr:hypothetical protein [Fictibacillus gelatini]
MAIAEKVKETIRDAKCEELHSVVSELRVIGEDIECEKPGFFEDENLDFIIKHARKISKLL